MDFDHLLLSYALVNIVIRFFNFSFIEVTGGTGNPRGGRGLFFKKLVLLEQVFALLLN